MQPFHRKKNNLHNSSERVNYFFFFHSHYSKLPYHLYGIILYKTYLAEFNVPSKTTTPGENIYLHSRKNKNILSSTKLKKLQSPSMFLDAPTGSSGESARIRGGEND